MKKSAQKNFCCTFMGFEDDDKTSAIVCIGDKIEAGKKGLLVKLPKKYAPHLKPGDLLLLTLVEIVVDEPVFKLSGCERHLLNDLCEEAGDPVALAEAHAVVDMYDYTQMRVETRENLHENVCFSVAEDED